MGQEIILQAKIDLKDVKFGLNELDAKLKGVETKGSSTGGSLFSGFSKAAVGIGIAVTAVTALGAGINKTIGIASDFQEANSKLLTVYKGMNSEARAAREELVNSYNLSIRGSTKLLANTGAVVQGMGLQRKESLKLSADTIKLAADLASFSNYAGGAEGATEALTAAYVGERERLKSLGIVITEADVKQKLFDKGQQKLTGNALKTARAQATYELAVEKAGVAVGDLSRTQDSYANTQRKLENQVDDLGLALGAVFLPIMTKVLSAITDMLDAIGPENIAGVFFAAWAVIERFGTNVWKLFSNLGEGIWNLLTGNFEESIQNFTNVGEALWDVGLSGIQGYVDAATEGFTEGKRAFAEFIEGETQLDDDSTDSKIDNIARVTKEEQEAFKKRGEAFLEYMTTQRENLNEIGDFRREKFEEQIELENEKIDFLFETEQLTTQQYLMVLQERLANAIMLDGERSKSAFKIEQQIYKVKKDAKDKEKKLEDEATKGRIQGAKQLQGSLYQLNQAFGGKLKGLSIAQALINTYLGSTKALAQGGIFGLFQMAAVLTAGFAQVAKISAVKLAKGGLIEQPTFGLVGEAGPEIVAPKDDFLKVVNKLGISDQNNMMVKSINNLSRSLSSRPIIVEVDSRQIAIANQLGGQIINEERL